MSAGARIYGFLSELDRDRDQFMVVTCAWCNRMRHGDVEAGTWLPPAHYFMENKDHIKDPELDYAFTHGMCPVCAESLDVEAPG